MARTAKKDEFPPLDGYDPDDVAAVERARRHKANPQEDPTPVLGGVTVTWLASVFQTDHKRVKQLLRGVPPTRVTGHGPLYDIRVAAARLVPPKATVEEYLRLAKRADLPVAIQHQFWSAMQKRQKYEEDAKQLWRTEAVLDALGDLAKEIRGSVMLWMDNVDREVGLNKEQRAALQAQTDHLMKKIHEIMVEAPRRSSHQSSVEEIGRLMEATETAQRKELVTSRDLEDEDMDLL